MSEDLSAFAKKRRTKKVIRFLFLGVLLTLLLGTATYFLLENFFVVKEVSVMKSEIYKSADIADCAKIKKGTPLHKVDGEAIAKRIENKFPYLEDVEVSADLPQKIKIKFREEYGKFSIALGVELFAIDDNLQILAKEDGRSGIERIKVTSGDVKRCVVGEKVEFIDKDTAPILLNLIKVLNENGMIKQIRSIDVSNQFDIHLDYAGRFDVAMGDHQDMSLKLAMVQEILKDKDLASDATGSIDIFDSDQAYLKLNDPVA
ncbi:MAG: FtsQ-type POTRA domain-containing protein [Ruminococcaceae bacterium]|nr:FtsQ-type POTRA domain-containing protein [Oscillospiraceae bacterium]